jgi:hypothetical protein
MRRGIFVLSIIVAASCAFTQTINITGKVSDNGGVGISNAIVKIFNTALA